MTASALPLAFIAGLLTVLSPCVLPLLPITFGAAASEHRYGPVALAVGLALSFTLIGLFVAAVGFSIGLDADVFRLVSAVIMLAIGLVLLSQRLQDEVARLAGPLSDRINSAFGTAGGSGLGGQFGLGVLLGAVWSPCVGPTLGAASILAAQGRDLPQVGLIMLVFGIGAALPLLALGAMSRSILPRLRNRLGAAGRGLKVAMGALLILVGAAIVTGYDKKIEAFLTEASPDWLNRLTTRF